MFDINFFLFDQIDIKNFQDVSKTPLQLGQDFHVHVGYNEAVLKLAQHTNKPFFLVKTDKNTKVKTCLGSEGDLLLKAVNTNEKGITLLFVRTSKELEGTVDAEPVTKTLTDEEKIKHLEGKTPLLPKDLTPGRDVSVWYKYITLFHHEDPETIFQANLSTLL